MQISSLIAIPAFAEGLINVSLVFYTVSYSYPKGEPSTLRIYIYQALFYDELTDYLVTLMTLITTTTTGIPDSELFIS